MSAQDLQVAAKILIDFHRLYFQEQNVLSEEDKKSRHSNLVLLFEYYEKNVEIQIKTINLFIRNNARSKDKVELEKARELRASINALLHLITFLVAKCCLLDNLDYASGLLKKIPSDWEKAYAAKLLFCFIDIDVFKFCKNHELDKLLTDECTKVIEKFSNSFNDFKLIQEIGKQRSKKIQCLLYLLVRTVDNILSLLQVNFNDNERKVAHYTSIFGFQKIVCEDSDLRLSSGDLMNDPSEGKLLWEFLGIKSEIFDDTFLTSFTFNHNSLNQFRLYGCTNNKEGTGISLVVGSSFFSSDRNGFISSEILGDMDIFKVATQLKSEYLPLFRCIYFDKNTGFLQVAKRSRVSFYQEYVNELNLSEIHDKCVKYDKDIDNLEIRLNSEIQNLKYLVFKIKKLFFKNSNVDALLNRTLRPLCFLFKHVAFQEEQECRIFYITEIGNSTLEADINSMAVYYPYKAKIKDSLRNVYLGPALQEKFTYVRKAVVYDSKIKVKVCDSPFVSK